MPNSVDTDTRDGCKPGSWYLVADQNAKQFFPFTIYPEDNGHYVTKPEGFLVAFLAAKPERASWYTFSVEVFSRTQVTFTIYDMRDNVFGGLGRRGISFNAVVDESVTSKAIEREAFRIAQDARQSELEAAERAVIEKYKWEILSQITW